MQMWMMNQILVPGVKNGEEPDLSAEMFGVGGDGEQGFRCGAEQNAVNGALVLKGDVGNLFRHGKDGVKVRAIEKLGFTGFDPLGPGQGLAFGTVAIRTGVVAGMFMPALTALFQMTAKSSRAAQRDVVHDTPVFQRDEAGVTVQIGLAVTAEHIRQFQMGPVH